MKYSNNLRYYGIRFSFCCFLVIASTQQVCPPPDVPVDGEYTPKSNNFFPGDKVTYTCKGGYILIGKDIRICRSNGFWTEKTPFCDRSEKLKNPRVSNMVSPRSISHVIDNNSDTCFTWEKSIGHNLQLYLDDEVVIHIIRIFLKAGTTKVQILTGLDNNMKVCANYDRFIETSQWVTIKCNGNDVHADTMKILNTSGRSTNITICEVQVYVKDENSCEHSPDVRVANGYFKVSRTKATLICEDGYKSENARIVCEGKSWKNVGSRCDENLCNAKVSNSTLTVEGEWKFLDSVSKISAGTRRLLICNTDYEMRGGPERATCLKNGMWTKTNATCVAKKAKPSKHVIIIVSVGALVGIIILTLLGITICLIRKQRSREVVVVYKSTDGSIARGSESEYASVHYESIQPSVPATPRPTALPSVLSDGYILSEDSKGTLKRKPMPADIAFGTLKQSSLYAN